MMHKYITFNKALRMENTMNLQKCPNNHYYNSDKFPYCPHCSNSIRFKEIKKENENNPFATSYEEMQNIHIKESAPKVPTENVTPLTATSEPLFDKLTIGWLVCLTGANRGRSYTIYPGDNHIGRNMNMNVCIKNEATISREDHAIIHYNRHSNIFTLKPNISSNPTIVNDETISEDTIINDRDLIQLGECQLLFVSLCNKHFNW